MLMVLTPAQQMKAVINDSYRNFHAKGVDYICLHRSRDLTVKVYFFDYGSYGGVVNPHNHRYDFATTVLRGGLVNQNWSERSARTLMQRYDYYTPLNGGRGFVRRDAVYLGGDGAKHYTVGDRYLLAHDTIHTLGEIEPKTVLMLWQYRDVLSTKEPTQTFFAEDRVPSLDGLYTKHTPEQIVSRLREIEDIKPRLLQKYALHTLADISFAAAPTSE